MSSRSLKGFCTRERGGFGDCTRSGSNRNTSQVFIVDQKRSFRQCTYSPGEPSLRSLLVTNESGCPLSRDVPIAADVIEYRRELVRCLLGEPIIRNPAHSCQPKIFRRTSLAQWDCSRAAGRLAVN